MLQKSALLTFTLLCALFLTGCAFDFPFKKESNRDKIAQIRRVPQYNSIELQRSGEIANLNALPGESRIITPPPISAPKSIPQNEIIQPITSPQTANISTPPDSSKRFFRQLFNNPEPTTKNVIIQDEIANNQKPKDLIQKIKSENTPTQETNKSLPAKAPDNKKGYYVQVGAYSKKTNANNVTSSLQKYGNASTTVNKRGKRDLHIVKIGPFKNKSAAKKTQSKISKSGFKNTILIYNK
jgi:cell division protein FtsN